MAILSNESFFETTLTAAITASQSTIPVTILPNITASYLVIEANTSNREIISYSGYTGTAGSAGTLTGVVRGLASYGSNASAGTGKAHPAGVDIANKDVHYYYAQYYDFLQGTSATGANVMRIGDGNTTSASNRLWYVHTSSISAWWGLSANGQMVISEDGVTSYVVSAGGSGVTAGDGIDITAGVVTTSYLSASGLALSGSKLIINADWNALKTTSASELYFDPTTALTYSGANTFSGSNIFSGEQMGMDCEYFDADEVIAVSVTPKPVKLTSAGRVYMCSSNDSTGLHKFVGFAITASSAAGTQVKVKTKGLVDGFSGLTPGEVYYAVSAAGNFGTSPGTAELRLGIAGSATQILIDKAPHWEFISAVASTRLDGTKYYANIVVPTNARHANIWYQRDNNVIAYSSGTVILDKYFNTNETIWCRNDGSSSYTQAITIDWGTSSISLTSSYAGNATECSCRGIAYFYT